MIKKYFFKPFLYAFVYVSLIFGLTSCLGFGFNILTIGNIFFPTNNRTPDRQPQRNETPQERPNNKEKNPISQRNTELDLRKMSCRAKMVEEQGDSLRVFLEMDIPRLSTQNYSENLSKEITLALGILESYTAKELLSVQKIDLNTQKFQYDTEKGFYYTSVVIEKRPLLQAVLITDLKDLKTGQRITPDTSIPYLTAKLKEKFYVAKADNHNPYFTQYLLDKDMFQIRNTKNEDKIFFVKYFRNPQEPATPPMSMVVRNPQKQPKADSIFSLKSNTKTQFQKKGLYVVQTDTADFYGITLYIGERQYPKYTKIQDVIEPLIYITTEGEMQNLKKKFNETSLAKKELDKIWLSLMKGNTKLAQSIIRTYYTRVKLANHFFTSYKEGWKTDMGMVYIVYGSPDKTIKNQDTEYWFYTKDPKYSEIKFTFNRRPNALSDNNYMLSRYPEYEPIWYPAIEKWREGKIQ